MQRAPGVFIIIIFLVINTYSLSKLYINRDIYFCHYLLDDFVDLSYLYVVLSDVYVDS